MEIRLIFVGTDPLTNTKRIDIAVGDIPVEEPVRVLGGHETGQDQKNKRKVPYGTG